MTHTAPPARLIAAVYQAHLQVRPVGGLYVRHGEREREIAQKKQVCIVLTAQAAENLFVALSQSSIMRLRAQGL